MSSELELFYRMCRVLNNNGAESPLKISFYVPKKNPIGSDYLARANISCKFFEKDVYGNGEDAAQAFFWLPIVVVSYLVGQRRMGYEAYWVELGDLSYKNFWTYEV